MFGKSGAVPSAINEPFPVLRPTLGAAIKWLPKNAHFYEVMQENLI